MVTLRHSAAELQEFLKEAGLKIYVYFPKQRDVGSKVFLEADEQPIYTPLLLLLLHPHNSEHPAHFVKHPCICYPGPLVAGTACQSISSGASSLDTQPPEQPNMSLVSTTNTVKRLSEQAS